MFIPLYLNVIFTSWFKFSFFLISINSNNEHLGNHTQVNIDQFIKLTEHQLLLFFPSLPSPLPLGTEC